MRVNDHAAVRFADLQPHSARPSGQDARAVIGGPAECEGAHAVYSRRQSSAVGVVDVHDGDPRIADEETSFGLEVVLHRAVEIEVISSDVGEHGYREAQLVAAGESKA